MKINVSEENLEICMQSGENEIMKAENNEISANEIMKTWQ